jgi:hypothetical protein
MVCINDTKLKIMAKWQKEMAGFRGGAYDGMSSKIFKRLLKRFIV